MIYFICLASAVAIEVFLGIESVVVIALAYIIALLHELNENIGGLK